MSVRTFKDRFTVGVLITLATFFARTAIAQSGQGYGSRPVVAGYGMGGSYSEGSGYGGSGASTAAESVLRGRAAVINAMSNYELRESRAGILREQARAMDRENNLMQTEALLAQKKMWSDARFQERAEGRKRIAVQRATIYRQAYQLSARDLNVKTGAIRWPNLLQDVKFQENRTKIEELFRQHIGYRTVQVNMAKEIARSADQWAQVLQKDVGSMPREDYLAAQKFLLGLKYGAMWLVEST